MKKLKLFLTILCCTVVIPLSAQQKKIKPVARNAEIEKVGTDFIFTEGPAVAPDGRVYFTDQPNDKIHVWDEREGISLYIEGTGRSNGMYFNANGQLVSCADEKNQLVYFDEDKKRHVIHEGFEGKHLNAPNDLWINGGQMDTKKFRIHGGSII
jgi:gluconolactonase